MWEDLIEHAAGLRLKVLCADWNTHNVYILRGKAATWADVTAAMQEEFQSDNFRFHDGKDWCKISGSSMGHAVRNTCGKNPVLLQLVQSPKDEAAGSKDEASAGRGSEE